MANKTNNSSNNEDQELSGGMLARAAAHATKWPHLLANVVDRYLKLNHLTEDDLCLLLRCDLDSVNHLRLCGRPDADPMAFSIDIKRLADKFDLDAGALASMVREVDAVEIFGSLNTSGKAGRKMNPFSSMSGMLQAARDQEKQGATVEQELDTRIEVDEATEIPKNGQKGDALDGEKSKT